MSSSEGSGILPIDYTCLFKSSSFPLGPLPINRIHTTNNTVFIFLHRSFSPQPIATTAPQFRVNNAVSLPLQPVLLLLCCWFYRYLRSIIISDILFVFVSLLFFFFFSLSLPFVASRTTTTTRGVKSNRAARILQIP